MAIMESVKLKSRWRRKSELESGLSQSVSYNSNNNISSSSSASLAGLTGPLPTTSSSNSINNFDSNSYNSIANNINSTPDKSNSNNNNNSTNTTLINFIKNNNSSVDPSKNDISDTANHHHHHHINNNHNHHQNHHNHHNLPPPLPPSNQKQNPPHDHDQNHHQTLPPTFEEIVENLYLFERTDLQSRSRKEARRMVCDCILTREERSKGIMGCADDCLNRMLMIECGNRCTLGDHCLNKRFQKHQSAKVEVFKTHKKGWGLRTITSLPPNAFIMEYVGEVVQPQEFKHRVKKYSKQKIKHHYFMALRSDEIIDATIKGNMTRFINHSCEPNCETQKWTVNGELRIGFFTKNHLEAGEEVTFDYQFQRYGKKAQKCYCEAPSCRGYIGGTGESSITLNGSRKSSKQSIKNAEHKENHKISKSSKIDIRNSLLFEDLALEEEIIKLSDSGGLKNRQQVIEVGRLMNRAEDAPNRHKLIDIVKATKDGTLLKLFLDYHGLQLLWIWMSDLEDTSLKAAILELLDLLPIPHRNLLTDSKILSVIERWSNEDVKLPPRNPESFTTTKPDQQLLSNNTNQEKKPVTQPTAQPSTPPSTPPPCTPPPSTPPLSLPVPAAQTPPPNIRGLASKLIRKWQDLKEVFRIPRLERQKRYEDEKEADRKAHESPNKLLEDDKFGSKRFVRATPFKSYGPLTAPGRENPTNKRHFDSQTNNEAPSPPKISKEERRHQFEMEVYQRDYQEWWQKYGALYTYQTLYQQFPGTAAAAMALGHSSPFLLDVSAQPLVAAVPLTSESVISGLPMIHENHFQQNSWLSPMGSQSQDQVYQDVIYDVGGNYDSHLYEPPLEEDIIPEPTNIPTVIVLAGGDPNDLEASFMDEKLAASICDYDSLPNNSKTDQLTVEQVMDQEYPCPGSYYTTPDGQSWFASVTIDRQTKRLQTVILNLDRSAASQNAAVTVTSTTKQSSRCDEQTVVQTTQITNNKPPSSADAASADTASVDTASDSPNADNNALSKDTRKIQEAFKVEMSRTIVRQLRDYYKPDCKRARIASKEDFRFLAKKLTGAVMTKELKICKTLDKLTCNDAVRQKAEEFVHIYMAKFGKLYKPEENDISCL